MPAVAGTVRLAELAGGGNIAPENARFFAASLPAVLHIPAVMLYSILGAFQFSRSFRRRRPGWHRAGGPILIPCGLLAALSGLWMARFYPWPQGSGQALYMERLVFGSAMVVSIGFAVDAIRRRGGVDGCGLGDQCRRGRVDHPQATGSPSYNPCDGRIGST
ncbi:MAG TPA: DUF2306 domain-containing protein, partial [Gemmatimonadaceae bacterium]